MSFLSGIFDTVKDFVSPVTDLLSGGLGSVVSAGADLLGGVMTNNANAAQAQKNRDFQADQTGTAYQRAVKDLQAAGLNPMLAYTNGGASSGSGAQAVMQNAVGSAIHTGMAAKMNAAQVDSVRAQVDNIKQQTKTSEATWRREDSQAHLNDALFHKTIADTAVSTATAANAKVDNLLKLSALPQAKNEASAQSSWWKRNISPYLSDLSSVSSSAASVAKTVNR